MSPSPRPRLSPSLPDQAGRLYAIVDADVCAQARRLPVDVARAFLAAGARLIQLRAKSWSGGAFLELARRVVAEANATGAMVIVNDRADVAALSGAHGVHVGQEDLSPADARAVVGDAAVVGLSTHTPEQWDRAIEEPVSYIAIGPVFGTGTKDTGYSAVGLDTVARASRAAAAKGLPVVAIGGITLATAATVIAAGAASVAVIGDLMAGDPRERCQSFLHALG